MVFIANVVRSTGIGVEKAVLRRTGIPQSLGYEVYALQFLRSQIVIGGPEEPPDDERPTLEETNGATTPLERCWAYFENTIAVIRGLAVQDQRDKIYCVLGMAGRFMPGGSNAIMKPDYTKHVEDVYIEVTMILMNNLPCLTTLGLVEDESLRLIPSLPSWVPDFSSRVSRNYLNIVMGRNNFNASRSTNRISYPRILNSQTLTLRGAPFDLVTALCATRMDIRVDHRLPQMTAVLRNIEFVRSILTICSDPVPLSSAYGATSFDIIRIALVPQSPQRRTDAQFGGIHAHDWFLMALSTGIGWLSELNTSLRACFTLLDGLRTGPSSPADSTHVTFPTLDRIRSYAQLLMTQPEQRDAQFWANAGQVETNAKAYDAQFGYLHVDRRLFRTANGFVGVGPLSIQPGDQIWVIQDSKFPFILRPVERAEKERAFKVVGECYVHGFMNGEMLDAGVGEMGDVHLV